MKTSVSAVTVALTLGLAGGLCAQGSEDALPYCEEGGVDWGLGPTFLSAPNGKRIGLRASLDACATGHTQNAVVRFPASWALLLDVDLVYAGTTFQVPDASVVSVGGGLSLSLSEPEEEAPDSIPFAELPNWDGGGFNLGFLDLGATIGYESSSDWSEQYLTLGAQARYAINARGLVRLLPSVVAQFVLVDPAGSEVRDASGLPGDTHWRWSLRGYWNTDLGFVDDALGCLRLQADAALYRTSELDRVLTDAGWNKGEYVTVSLSYVNRHKLLGPIALSSIYARYSGGRWPTAPVGGNAFTAGIGIDIGGS